MTEKPLWRLVRPALPVKRREDFGRTPIGQMSCQGNYVEPFAYAIGNTGCGGRSTMKERCSSRNAVAYVFEIQSVNVTMPQFTMIWTEHDASSPRPL
jgi:hypothetical protein